MNFIQRFTRLLIKPAETGFYEISVRCSRCGETITALVNIANDLSLEYDDSGHPVYHVRKALIGSGRCFQPVEVLLTFSSDRKLIDRQANGGEFLDSDH